MLGGTLRRELEVEMNPRFIRFEGKILKGQVPAVRKEASGQIGEFDEERAQTA